MRSNYLRVNERNYLCNFITKLYKYVFKKLSKLQFYFNNVLKCIEESLRQNNKKDSNPLPPVDSWFQTMDRNRVKKSQTIQFLTKTLK